MSITSAFVLFSVIWFMVFLIAIPIKLQTQGDLGEIVPGTHAGAPEVHDLKKKAWISTVVAFILWAMISSIIVSGMITMRDIDFFNRMDPETSDEISE
jgi:predicted secreted protein